MRLFILSGLLLGGLAGTASAQLPPRKAATVAVDASVRLLVANAVVEGDCTPADALAFSGAMRAQLGKALEGKVTVVTRDKMNDALKTFGYEADELLPEATVTPLADALKASKVVTTKLSKGANGLLAVVATVRGKGDVTATQEAGQSTAAFGDAVALLVKASL